MSCTKIKGKNRKVCIGSLDKRIQINARSLKAPSGDSVDFDLEHTKEVSVWAMIQTTRGDMLFDGVDLSTGVTHKIYVRWNKSFTFEGRIKHEGDYYEILDVENLDEASEFALMRCKKVGSVEKEVNKL